MWLEVSGSKSVDKQICNKQVLVREEIWRHPDPSAMHNLNDENKRDTIKNRISKLTNFVLLISTLISR